MRTVISQELQLFFDGCWRTKKKKKLQSHFPVMQHLKPTNANQKMALPTKNITNSWPRYEKKFGVSNSPSLLFCLTEAYKLRELFYFLLILVFQELTKNVVSLQIRHFSRCNRLAVSNSRAIILFSFEKVILSYLKPPSD